MKSVLHKSTHTDKHLIIMIETKETYGFPPGGSPIAGALIPGCASYGDLYVSLVGGRPLGAPGAAAAAGGGGGKPRPYGGPGRVGLRGAGAGGTPSGWPGAGGVDFGVGGFTAPLGIGICSPS